MDTIFFDWGGVIADDSGDDFLAILLRVLGANEQQIDAMLQKYIPRLMRGQTTEDEYWNIVRIEYGLEVPTSISHRFREWRGVAANQNILNLVDEAKQNGFRTALLSNVLEPTYKVIAEAGYYDHFDEVIASCKVGYAKPDAEIYELALNQLETTAERSFYIDDRQSNLEPAAAMGFKTILASNPEQIIRDVRACWGK